MTISNWRISVSYARKIGLCRIYYTQSESVNWCYLYAGWGDWVAMRASAVQVKLDPAEKKELLWEQNYGLESKFHKYCESRWTQRLSYI